MKLNDFLIEIQKIDPRLTIQVNPNRPGLSNIMLDGKDVCPIPTDDLREEDDPRHYYTFPNGYSAPHNSVTSAKQKIHLLLEKLKDPKVAEEFYSNED